MGKRVLMQGNQAVAEAALVAGVKFCAGYPITPASETMELLARKLPSRGGRFIQMEDEIASMGAVIGASAAGKKAITITSGPGFSLKQENLGYASMIEMPVVVYNAQRAGPSTGGATKPQQGDMMQARWGSHGDSPRIALCPGTVREAYDLTIHAFNLSETYMMPVIILSDQLLAHNMESMELPDPDTIKIVNRRTDAVPHADYLPYQVDETGIPVLPPLGQGYRYNMSGMLHGDKGVPDLSAETIDKCIRRINGKLTRYRDDIVQIEHIRTEGGKIALFVYGSVSRPAKGAIKMAEENGIPVDLIRPITIWPFPDKEIRAIAEHVDKIIVAEMNMGQIVGEVRSAVEGRAEVIPFNKVNSLPFTVLDLYNKIVETLNLG